MALLKEETLPQGITLAYHRILRYEVDLPRVRVLLAGYVSKEFRDQEKERIEKQSQLTELAQQIQELQGESGEEQNEAALAELGDQYNQLTAELSELKTENLYVRTAEFEVEVEGEATREAIYQALMKLPNFVGAVEV